MLARMRDARRAQRRADDMSADAVMVRAVDMTHRDWLRLNERRHQIRRAWGAFFQDWDVLLCPVDRHRRPAAHAGRRHLGAAR